jgi:glucosamine--fructose-6-phosphate aminotransferase (isomerizing)
LILSKIGIFGYLNYLVKRDRRFIADILINGLHRLEYRGYDSSGIAFDGDNLDGNRNDNKRACLVVRQKGKVEELEHAVKCKKNHFVKFIYFSSDFSIGKY